jgi:Domain of unknown function (DUF4440)
LAHPIAFVTFAEVTISLMPHLAHARMPLIGLSAISVGIAGSAMTASPLRAQSDEQAVVGVVNKFFDGMRTRDTALLRSTVVPGTMLQQASGPTGLGQPRTIDQFIENVGKGTGPGGNEQIKDPKVQMDQPLASLWAYFTFKRGGQTQIDHCGVDLFLLRKGPDGWKIFQITDTHRTEGCTPISS